MIDQTRYLSSRYEIRFLNQRLEPELVTVYADDPDQALSITYKQNKRVIRILDIKKL